ncbi:MAG: BON domain-containing protein [Planctomycetota bacterium]|nr:BON domain-containing protein [Planctomycetota bacterium]
MKTYVQICLACVLAFFLCPLRCDGQVKSHGGSDETSKPKMQSTLTEGSTMAGGSKGDTLGEAVEFSTSSIADKIPSGRFLKDKRRSGDFVGTDAGDRREFVGSQGTSGAARVRSATSGLRVKKSREANVRFRAATERRNAMYDPRLVIAFDVNRQSPLAIQADLRRRLADFRHLEWAGSLSVTVRGDTAVLAGKVASLHDREMAEMVLMFEPGISKVENRLQVSGANQQLQPVQQQGPQSVQQPQPQSYPEYKPVH